jgi:hypothetical protein
MPGVVRTNRIVSSGNIGTIVIPTGNKMIGTTANTFASPHRAGEVVQQVSSNAMPTAHITVTSLSETAADLKIWLTPAYSSSKILVEWYSQMIQGSANAIITILYRSTDGGSTFVNITPFQNAASRYYYGWNYNSDSWRSQKQIFVDFPQSTGNVVYKLHYRNLSTTATNYLVHQYQEYGWNVTEIAQ